MFGFLISFLAGVAAWAAAPVTGPLTVYTYDAFAAKGSIGPVLEEAFAKKHGVKVRLIKFGSAGEALNQVALEGKATKADVLVGVDESLLPRARELAAFESLGEALVARVPAELRFDGESQFLPFDYGFLTLVYDSRRVTPPSGMSLGDFARFKGYAGKLVIEDPRTSSIGLNFLLWTRSLGDGKAFTELWRGLKQQVLTVSPGWSGAYGLFLKKEADFVVSYTTSPAYHVEKENNAAIRGMSFKEGHYRQTEGVGIVRFSAKKALARAFVSLLLSDEIQARVPTTQWMYPVARGVKLPASFAGLPKVDKPLSIDAAVIARTRSGLVREWTLLMAEKK